MEIKGFLVLIVGAFLSSTTVKCQNNQSYERVPVIPPPRRAFSPELTSNHIDRSIWSSGYMQIAKNFVASPFGQLTMSMAKEVVARSAGGNEVLSLNLTSLLVIVILKALIFTTGLLGAGHWNQYARGRMLDDSN